VARTETVQPASSPDRKFAWVLLLLTLFLYWQTTNFDFINLDDPDFITENPNVNVGLTGASILWALTTNYINWQPLVYLSHQAVVTVFGLDPTFHHFVNALLHAVNAALVFLVFRRLRLALWPAAIAAAVFAVHPLRVESVAWVTERKDVLSALFWLLTMWAYIRYTEAPKEKSRYWLTVLFFALGLMAKPMLVTLPVCLLILDFWPLRRTDSTPLRDLILEKIPLAVLSVAAAVVTIIGQKSVGAMATFNDLPLQQRAANVLRSYAIYVWKTVFPTDLAVVYPFPEQFPAFDLVLSALLLAGISYFVWTRRATSPWWIAAWAWYIVAAAPTIGFIQVGPQPWADRYSYLPSLLPMAALALALAGVLGERKFRIGGAVVTFILFVMSWVQIGTWRNDFTLYRHAIAVAPGASIVYMNLGVALEKFGKFNEAINNYKIAVSLNDKQLTPHLNIGLAYLQSGRPSEAIAPLARAVELQPNNPTPRYHYSRALLESGKLEEAIVQVKQAQQLSPSPAWPRLCKCSWAWLPISARMTPRR
jgi:4-amino-4-deoxy-L-arabinose transferase-like glycosyltransferase